MNITEEKMVTQKILKRVVIGKKCDVCGKGIPPSVIVCGGFHPYFTISTHHHDWGNDSCESYQEYDVCSPECAVTFAKNKLSKVFDGHNTEQMEISHKNGWFLHRENDEE